MRRLFRLIAVLVVLAVLFVVGNTVARDRVQSVIEHRIEQQVPGSRAVVRISGFPFLVRLVASGKVQKITADVSNVRDGSVSFEQVDVTMFDLRVDRSQLVRGEVRPIAVEYGELTADISQAEIDALVHLPVSLGRGVVTVDGRSVGVTGTVQGRNIVLHPAGLPAITIPVQEGNLFPCLGAPQVQPGAVRLSCRFTVLPGVLRGTKLHL